LIRIAPARAWLATFVALVLVLGHTVPASAASAAADSSSAGANRALDLLDSQSCATHSPLQIAQATSPAPAPSDSASPNASASPSPSPSPSLIPVPRAPNGPTQLLIPLPSPTPGAPSPPPIPTPSPSARASSGPVLLQRVTPTPSPSPSGSASASPSVAPTDTPKPAPTLGINEFAILGDEVTGNTNDGAPADASGNVNLLYTEGVIVADHAHYDGKRYIDMTGHTYVRNKADDSIIYADSIRFDTVTRKATLLNGHGETTQGVERGKFYFKAKTLTTDRNGNSHGDRASFTTCENPRGGYHVEAKSIDLKPDDKLIARSAVLFLGALAVFYIPVLIIPLKHDQGPNKAAGFIPEIGYSQVDGLYVRARLGFAPSDDYFGYYRLEYYQKTGYGLGYVATFKRKNNKRLANINVFSRKYRGVSNTTATNLNVDESENFSPTLRGQFSAAYTGNYGTGISLPPNYNYSGSVAHAAGRSSQSYTFQRNQTSGYQSSNNFGFVDQRTISQNLTQAENVSYTTNSTLTAPVSKIDTLHFNTLTHLQSIGASYDLTIDKTESASPSGIDKLPELQIRPNNLLPHFRAFPISTQFTIGEYSERQTRISTAAYEGAFNFGPALLHLGRSDFSAGVNVKQDAFGTGDFKASVAQNMTLTTPLGTHFSNLVQYNENNSNGPQAEPFKTYEIISGASHGAQDVLRIFNGDSYVLTLSDGTFFNRQAQPLSYQLSARPSRRSSLSLGGAYVPGPGNGFATTNVQILTPFGRDSELQFFTNVNWKERGRLENKTVYYSHIVGNCYEVRLQYNQSLKTVNVGIELLAFPSRSANFGLGNQGPIIPQSFGNY
jgi:hypothetical protein